MVGSMHADVNVSCGTRHTHTHMTDNHLALKVFEIESTDLFTAKFRGCTTAHKQIFTKYLD